VYASKLLETGKGDYGEGVSLVCVTVTVELVPCGTQQPRKESTRINNLLKWEVQKRPLLYVSSFHFCFTSIRGCIYKNMVFGMGPYAGVDFNSPYLIVNSVVSYPPPIQWVCRWFRFAQLAKGKKFRP
jgi:hypothetical protein